MMAGNRILIAVGAVAAFLLQVLLAPHIAIGSVVPNFMAAFCVALAIARPEPSAPVLPFIMGLVYDLLSGGPVGAMAFSLTAFTALGSWLFRRAGNDTLFMAVAVLAGSMLMVEVGYGLVVLLSGYSAGLFDAIAFRMAPCFVYDLVIAVVVYLLAVRFLDGGEVPRSEIKQL